MMQIHLLTASKTFSEVNQLLALFFWGSPLCSQKPYQLFHWYFVILMFG